MIVLDASIVIAHFDSRDAHHQRATALFRGHLDDDFLVHTLTLTEILVGPIRVGHEALALQHLDRLHIRQWAPGNGGALRLAQLRAESALKLPDCCVLDAAIATGSPLATFDERLAACAASFGVPTLP
jgi:predicted nucleic acid-binding protein